MKKEIKETWVEALRSGEYKQHRGELTRDGKYCCLAVLGVINGLTPKEDDQSFEEDSPVAIAPYSSLLALGISSLEQQDLVGRNDNHGLTFEEIADYIEANIPEE